MPLHIQIEAVLHTLKFVATVTYVTLYFMTLWYTLPELLSDFDSYLLDRRLRKKEAREARRLEKENTHKKDQNIEQSSQAQCQDHYHLYREDFVKFLLLVCGALFGTILLFIYPHI